MSRKDYPLTGYLNSVNFSKENLLEEDPQAAKYYPPYIVNKALSHHIDSVLYANEMNRNYHLDKDLQYLFYLNSLRRKKRFSPWHKKEKVDELTLIKDYFKYSDEKARDALRILTKDQIELIKQKMNTGGRQ
jgi:hypothetical protein